MTANTDIERAFRTKDYELGKRNLTQAQCPVFCAAGNIKYGEPDPSKMWGDGRMEILERKPAPPYLRAESVKFVRGAHTRWHYHDGEQMLLVTQGEGFVEFQNLPTLKIRKGDRVFVPS